MLGIVKLHEGNGSNVLLPKWLREVAGKYCRALKQFIPVRFQLKSAEVESMSSRGITENVVNVDAIFPRNVE